MVEEESKRLGPLKLVPGVSPFNASSYLLIAFAGIMLTTFISVIQPYVLNVNLGLPVEEQGRVSGDMVLYGEIVILLLSAVVGAASDRIGRRGVFAAGFVLLAMGYALYGYVYSVGTLAAVRIFLAVGIAIINVMVAAVQADYPQEESRGKLVGITGFSIGLGAMLIGIGLARMPYWFVGAGYDELQAGRMTMFAVAIVAVLLSFVSWFGLSPLNPGRCNKKEGFAKSMAIGLKSAGENPRIALAYGCAFVSRADLVVVGTFYVLWLNQAGLLTGMTVDEASKNAGMFFAMVMGAALLWAPVSGWLNDRLNRVSAMALAMLICAVGYGSMGLLPDPLGGWMYPAGVLLGLGQMSAITASQTLIGQEAPKEQRGAVIGVFSFFGAAGVMFITFAGGRLYDAIDPSAPFVLIGIVNAMLFVSAMLLRPKQELPREFQPLK